MPDTDSDLGEAARRAQAQLNYDKATVPFYVSLGRFLHQYSVLESAMLIALTNVSSVLPAVAKSIYSGTRVGTSKDYINRILDATGHTSLKNELKPYFDQIGLITSMRDEILHYGATYDHSRDALIVSNERVAHIPDKLRRIEVTPELLDDLAHDTTRAICGVMLCLTRRSNPLQNLSYFESAVASPWRYKQPPLVPLDPENP